MSNNNRSQALPSVHLILGKTVPICLQVNSKITAHLTWIFTLDYVDQADGAFRYISEAAPVWLFVWIAKFCMDSKSVPLVY